MTTGTPSERPSPESEIRALFEEQRAADRERIRNEAVFQHEVRQSMATITDQLMRHGKRLDEHELRIEQATKTARKAHDSQTDLESAVMRHMADTATAQLQRDEGFAQRLTAQDIVLKRLDDAEKKREDDAKVAAAIAIRDEAAKKAREDAAEDRSKRIERWLKMGMLAILVINLLGIIVGGVVYVDGKLHGDPSAKPPKLHVEAPAE
jgi:hypothetical protein